MTRMISSLAACVWVAGLLSAGTGSAQSSMSQGTMSMQGDSMQGQMSGSQSGKDMTKKNMKAKDTMKTGGTRADCHHKAGMQKDAMKKQEMMKACDKM